MIFPKPLVVKIEKISSWDSLTTMVSGIIFGILLTFYFPTYFIGIFIIRAFASYQKETALEAYERKSFNYESSYMVSYYLTSAAAFATQIVMWVSLIGFSRSNGFGKVLFSMTYQKIVNTSSSWCIDMTHVVLAGFMIAFAVYTLMISKRAKNKSYGD